jgi:hypothetical protein
MAKRPLYDKKGNPIIVKEKSGGSFNGVKIEK